MKKFLSFMLGICLIIPSMFVLSACGKDPGPKMETWDGSTKVVSQAVENVIKIETAEELAGLASAVKHGDDFAGITIKLTCDMDLANREWTPIGFGSSGGTSVMDGDSKAFAGIFDGQGHTIYNLKITEFIGGGLHEGTSSGVALFGHVTGYIQNITVNKALVKGNHYVGAVIGFASGAEIENCHAVNANVSCVYANSDESGDKAGAVIGHIQNHSVRNAWIMTCSAKNSNVDADRDAGQVLGCLSTNDYGTGTYAAAVEIDSVKNVEVVYNESGKNLGSSTSTNINNSPIGRIHPDV